MTTYIPLDTNHSVLRELGHPVRLKILEDLSHGRKTYSQLVTSTGETISSVKHHLHRLTVTGAVRKQRADSRTVYYYLCRESLRTAILYLEKILERSMEDASTVS